MAIPTPTKNMVVTFLKDELEKNGVQTRVCKTVNTCAGKREIDIICENGTYVCEAKFTEKDFLKAIGNIQNDFTYYEGGIKGGFSVLYPDELSNFVSAEKLKRLLTELKFTVVIMYPPEDTNRNFRVFTGTISEVAHELCNTIMTPPAYVEPDIKWMIKSLRKAAAYMALGLTNLTGTQLKDIFGGLHVFENILHLKKKEYPVEELQVGSAYLLLNQVLFYHILSRRTQLPEIETDTLQVPSQLNQYFDAVSNEYYTVIFSYDVASIIPETIIDSIKLIINVIKGISPEKIGSDFLGTVFHDIIPFTTRKCVGAYYTNVYAADLLTWLSIKDYHARVSDFAAGSGGLLVSAYQRKKCLLELVKEFSEKDHITVINQLTGIEVMPFAAHVAVCHLALQWPEHCTENVNVAVWDSTELKPGVTIPSLTGVGHGTGQEQLDRGFQGEIKGERKGEIKGERKGNVKEKEKGVLKYNEKGSHSITLKKSDVVVMNPPFTRQERIPDRYKSMLMSRFGKYKKYVHGQLSYYGYYILLADKFLGTGGRLAFVLPAAFLRVHSSEGIRKLLLEKYDIEIVITGRQRLTFSDSTWRREILFIAKKSLEKGDTIFAGIEKLPESRSELERICKKIEGVTGEYTDHDMSAFCVSRKELEENLDWFRFIAPLQSSYVLNVWELIKRGENLEKFGVVYNFKEMRRGIETAKGMKVQTVFILYSLERAIRRDDAWILNSVKGEEGLEEIKGKEDIEGKEKGKRKAQNKIIVYNRYSKDTIEILRNCVVPCLRTISNNKYMKISEKTDFVVIKNFQEAHKFFYNKRAKYRNMLPQWKHYVKKRMGNLVILRRFVINAPGTFHVCYYTPDLIAPPGTAWVLNLNDDDAKILCLWFNSSINLAQIFFKRIEDVWIDIHKYMLHDFYVINTKVLSNKEKEKLLHIFELYQKKEMPSLVEQYTAGGEYKRDLDTVILSILGFNDAQIDDILQELYHALKTQFKALQKMK
ncbi:MAG: N-6 DNA methylase [Candidatus Methanofastidiosia archaeon]|jgi:hypothetical protein